MSVILPSSVNYSEVSSALPENSSTISNVISPSNGSTYSPNSIIQFDLPSTSFLVPDSLSIRYTYTATTAVSSHLVGLPALAPFSRFETIIGSQTIESIQNYNQVVTLLSNLSLSVSEKYGSQSSLGFKSTNDATQVTLDELDGRIMTENEVGSFSAPLPCMLSFSEKLVPLFALPSIRIQMTVDSLTSMFSSGTGTVTPTNMVLSNLELCFRTVNLGSEVDQMVRDMGSKIFIKSQSFANSAQFLPANTQGQLSLVFNQRLASVKAAFILGAGTDVTSVNKWGDSFALSNSCDYQLNIASVAFPQRPLSTIRNKAGILQELRESVGSIYDRKNSLSINNVEFGRVCGDTSTEDQPAKFICGINLEKLDSKNSLLTGISTANSPITMILNTSVATSKNLNMHLILNYDVLMQIDPVMREVQILQ